MKRQLFTLMLLLLGTLMSHAQYSVLNGDLNHDGKITVEDMTMMANIILEKIPAEAIVSATEQKYVEVTGLAESAELLNGMAFNVAIKQLVRPSARYWDEDHTIKKITFHKDSSNEGIVVNSERSLGETRAIYNTDTQEVDIYVAANKLVFPESCNTMFYLFCSLSQIDWSAFGPNIDTNNVTNMSSMFGGCSALTTLDVSHFDTSKVTNMNGMFQSCSALTTLNVSHFDTSKVTEMGYMFDECSDLTTLNVSHLNTSNVTNMGSMFSGCSALTTLDVLDFDTGQVTNMSYMFYDSSALTTLDVSHFNTSNVTNMSGMFSSCYKLSSLKLGSGFTIESGCKYFGMLNNTPNDPNTPYCTINCTEATQDKLLVLGAGINESKIRWNIL